ALRRRPQEARAQGCRTEGRAQATQAERRRVSAGSDTLRREIQRAAVSLGAPHDVAPVLERPRDPAFGDWATNIAMVLAKPMSQKPRDLAQRLLDVMDFNAAGLASAEIAGPGFINFRLDASTVAKGIAALVSAGSGYG